MKKTVKTSARFIAVLIALLLAAIALQGPTWAQGLGSAPAVDPLKVETQGASLRSDFLSDESGVEISTGEEGEQASLKLAFDRGPTNYSIVFSSPTDKETERADFVGFDGFNSEATVKLAVNHEWWPKVGLDLTESEEVDLVLYQMRNCLVVLGGIQKVERRILLEGASDKAPALVAAAKAIRGKKLPTRSQVETYLKEKDPDRYTSLSVDQLKVEPAKTWAPIYAMLGSFELSFSDSGGVCGIDTMAEASKYLGLSEGLVGRRLAAGKTVAFVSADLTAGRKTFEFFDPMTLEADSSNENPGSIGVTFGWAFLEDVLGTPEDSLAISVRLETGYKAADSVQVCEAKESPVATKTVETCSSMALGPPGDSDSTFFGVEYRHLGTKIGTGFRVYYRGMGNTKDDFGFDVPVYFLKTSEKKLTGGARFGWSDLAGDPSITIFVGKAFESLGSG